MWTKGQLGPENQSLTGDSRIPEVVIDLEPVSDPTGPLPKGQLGSDTIFVPTHPTCFEARGSFGHPSQSYLFRKPRVQNPNPSVLDLDNNNSPLGAEPFRTLHVAAVDQRDEIGRRPESPDISRSLSYVSIRRFGQPEVRSRFLRRVLGIVALQLFVIMTWIIVCLNTQEVWKFVQLHVSIAYIAMTVYFSLYIAVGFLKLGRACPSNIIILSIYTITLAYLSGYITIQCATWILLMALGVTAAMCIVLILVSLLTKIDVTGWGLYLTVSACLLMTYIVLVFVCSFILKDKDLKAMNVLNVTGAILGACLISLYLLYDLQMIIGGRRAETDPDEWLFAAMALTYDIIMLFVYILQLVGIMRRSIGVPRPERNT